MYRGILPLLVVILVGGVSQGAWGEERVALVIGNGRYVNAERLVNPTNDSADMAAALRRMGFRVRHETDLGFDAMRRVLGAFSRDADSADVALVYYAGHGVEVDSQNYLVPTDAELKHDSDVDYEAIPLGMVMRAVHGARKLKLVLLDACRVNPFLAQMESSDRSRSIGRGLARVEPSVGTLVSYAAKEGTVAADGDGRNSPYTAALLAHLNEPGLEINFLFRKVRDAVLEETGGQQEPFTYGSLPGEAIYLIPPPEVASGNASNAPAIPVAPSFSEAATAWAVTQGTTSVAVLRAFVERFPGTIYAAFAEARIVELEASGKVAALPPATPTTPGRARAPTVTECDKLARVSMIVGAPEPHVLWEELDPDLAIPACQRAVAEYPDEPRLQHNLANALYKADRFEEHVAPLRRAVDAGHVPAFADWGGIHASSEGVKYNPDVARRYIERAADAGDPHGILWLGSLYQNGVGVEVDYKRSLELYEKADGMGHYQAAALLGEAYEYGFGVEIDLDRARQYFERGASYGESLALNDLGYLYQHGQGVEQDYARALDLYRRSADGGNGRGLNNLGWMYQNGLGVEKNLLTALDYYLQGSRKRNATAMWNAAYVLDELDADARNPSLMAESLLMSIRLGNNSGMEAIEKHSMENWGDDSKIAVQQFLKSKGFYTGPLDGRIGPQTIKAARAFAQSD